MSDSAHPPINNNGSGILSEALDIVRCDRKEATHFVVQHGNRLKFLIELKSGIGYLKRTIAAYDTGLILLLRLISFIPKQLLILAKLGFFAKVKLHPTIAEHVPANARYNILVGTYDNAQKIVLQCFSQSNNDCIFVKVGNKGSQEQMERETQFLKNAKNYNTFAIPTLLASESMREGSPFSIQVTKGFNGNKVPLKMTAELFRISKEIAGDSINVDGEPHTFSHGDFAPWNIRKEGDTYTVFDWEHCGLRPVAFDVVYFCLMIEIALHHRTFDIAYDRAIRTVKQFAPDLAPNKELILSHFRKTTKTLIY